MKATTAMLSLLSILSITSALPTSTKLKSYPVRHWHPPYPSQYHASSGPSRRQTITGSQAVVQQVNQWTGDVIAVNTFLNTVVGSSDPASLAQTALKATNLEPGHLSVMLQLLDPNDAQGEVAASELNNVLSGIPNAIQSIINNPSNDNVQTQVNNINQLRCVGFASCRESIF
jgi:hypothetical protein